MEQHRENRTQMLRIAGYPIRAFYSSMDLSLQGVVIEIGVA